MKSGFSRDAVIDGLRRQNCNCAKPFSQTYSTPELVPKTAKEIQTEALSLPATARDRRANSDRSERQHGAAEKSPAPNGPTRGTSALGLGGKK
jgi:hypothetical protein